MTREDLLVLLDYFFCATSVNAEGARGVAPQAPSGCCLRSGAGRRETALEAVVEEVLARARRDVDAVTTDTVRRDSRRGGGVVGLDGQGGHVGRRLVAEVSQGTGRRHSRRSLSLVVAEVGHVGLLERRQVTGVALRLGVIALLALVQEDRDGDRGKDADDDDDDQELDESEATLTLLRRLADTSEHCTTSGRRV